MSQGAISRLETGRGVATPLLVVLKTAIALREHIARVAPEAVPAEFKEIAESLARHVGPDGHFRPALDGVDTQLTELISCYRAVPESQRSHLVDVARAAASALGTDQQLNDTAPSFG